MKQKTILKSLTDLSVEVIGVETVSDEEKKPLPEAAPPQQSPIPTTKSLPMVSAPVGLRGWGINE